MKILGIDEAARGPVLGPLIIAGVMIEEGDEKDIEGAKDSKLLSHNVRIELDKKIREKTKFLVLEVHPSEIDEALLSENSNLNWLEAQKQAEIINQLQPDKAIIDCPSPNCKAFENYLRDLLDNKETELIVEHKADMKYQTCAAASILAKVRREDIMEEVRKKYGDTGTGYPADPKTKKFVAENWQKHPEIFRKTWSTFKKHAKMKDQKTLGGF